MTTTRVLIADDQVMVRQGFTVLLNAEPGIEVVGQAVDGIDAVARVAELAPDVVLMDIRMPGVGGIEATRRIMTAPAGPSGRPGPGRSTDALAQLKARTHPGSVGPRAGVIGNRVDMRPNSLIDARVQK
ncbi:hypothetical protein GCM10010207_67620 [Streptomyces atratus]|nr:hypothetical protein GCM10010207_67620 [Streptomyces atratus]